MTTKKDYKVPDLKLIQVEQRADLLVTSTAKGYEIQDFSDEGDLF